MKKLLFLFTALTTFTLSASAQCLSYGLDYSTGAGAYAIAKAKLNADTIWDVITADYTGGSMSVFMGNAGGTFQPAVAYATGAGPTDVVAQDFDGDTDIDVAVSKYNSSGIVIFLNDGSGALTQGNSYTVSTAQSLCAGDFDNDGDQDLAVVNYGAGVIAIFLNNGGATFTGPATIGSGGANPVDILSGSFDGDANTDLAVANYSSGNLVLFSGDGAGGFTAGTPASTGSGPNGLDAQDINGDNFPDFVTADYSSRTASVFLNNGGTLNLSATLQSPTRDPQSVAFVKLAGDNYYDVAVSGGGVLIDLFKGNGDGTFQSMRRFALLTLQAYANNYPQLNDAVYFDTNGDGLQDFVGASYTTASLVTALGNPQGWIKAHWTNYVDPANISSWDFMRSDMLDTDGNWDLVATGSDKDSVAVLKGNGDGTFDYDTIIYAGDYPSDLLITDLNGDNAKDIAVLNYYGMSVKLLFNDGNGQYASATSFSVSSTNPYRFSDADLDYDGDKDLAFTDAVSGAILIYLNDGAGSFTQGPTIPAAHAYGYDILTGHFNSDTLVDIAVNYAYNTQLLTVFLATAPMTYPSFTDIGGYIYADRLEAADLNNDGSDDLLLGYHGGGFGGTFIYLNNGSGAFSAMPTVASNDGYESTTVSADMNMDGNADILMSNSFTNGFFIAYGNGDGTFQPVTANWTITGDTRGLAVNDYNNDGQPDIAHTDVSYRLVNVVLNDRPMVDLGADRAVCGGTALHAGSYAGDFLWSTGATTPGLSVSSSGTYWVRLVTVCDTVRDTVSITVNPFPTVSFSMNPSTVCQDWATFPLNSGTPAGGTYSGTGVSAGLFDPAAAGPGTHVLTYTYTDANNCTSTASATVVVDLCTGIGEQPQLEFTLRPNPADEFVDITIFGVKQQNALADIMDASGRIVRSERLTPAARIGLENLGAGIYFVRVRAAEGVAMKKLVIR